MAALSYLVAKHIDDASALFRSTFLYFLYVCYIIDYVLYFELLGYFFHIHADLVCGVVYSHRKYSGGIVLFGSGFQCIQEIFKIVLYLYNQNNSNFNDYFYYCNTSRYEVALLHISK